MKRTTLSFILASFALAALAPTASAQPFYTDPVGAVQETIPAGVHLLSIPFQSEKIFQGQAGVVDGATVEISSLPTLPANCYLQVLSGDAAGEVQSIASSDSSSITLASAVSGLAQTNSIAIREHFILADLVEAAGGSIPNGTTVTLYDIDGSIQSYTAYSNVWYDSGFVVSDSVPVFPGEGFAVNLPSPVDILMTGAVSVDPVNVPLPAGVALVGSLNPSPSTSYPSTIGELFGTLPNSSTITVYSSDGSLSFVETFSAYSGTWYDAGFSVVNGESVQAPGVLVVNAASPSTATLSPAN